MLSKTRIFLGVALIVLVLPALGSEAPEFLDVRFPNPERVLSSAVLHAPSGAQRVAEASLRQMLPELVLRWDGVSGSPKWLSAAPDETLTAHSAEDPANVVFGFLRKHRVLFGLSREEINGLEVSSQVPGPGGSTHIYFVQTLNGLEVHQGRLRATIDHDGALLSIGSRLFAGVRHPGEAILRPVEALSVAMEDVYPGRVAELRISSAGVSSDGRTVFESQPQFGRPPSTRQVLFPMAGETRLAWEVRVAESSFATDYVVLIDAHGGEVLWRENLTFYASARVITGTEPQPHGEEVVPPNHTLMPIPASTPQSPTGWIDPPGDLLSGNNAHSRLYYTTHPGLSSPGGIFDYAFNTDRAALVNAWYWVNEAHDRFYEAGFTESAGNFQADNFGLGGAEADAVQVLLDPMRSPVLSGTVSSMTSTIDGVAPVLVVGLKGDCRFCADYDGDPANGGERFAGFMADLLIHEYAHGVTSRRVGGPQDDTCLSGGVHARRMAEGWSDLFAASFLGEPHLYDYARQGQGWVNDPRHDLPFDEFCRIYQYSGNPVCYQLDSMIWDGALWALRDSMVTLDPSGGLEDFHVLIVESLAHTPCGPTMVDGRDGILAADTLLFGAAHHSAIWNTFASRGIGQHASATSENDTSPTADHTVRPEHVCTPPSPAGGLAAVAEGPNEVRLTYDASGAQAVEVWRDDLRNPADAPVRVGSTTDLSSFVDTTATGGVGYRYHVTTVGSGGVTCRSIPSASYDVTAGGACDDEFPLFVPNLTISDGSPDCSVALAWEPATPACPGSSEPIVYNIYREETPGFLPSDALLVGRTTATTFDDVPPKITAGASFHTAPYYLVLAQHGTPSDAPDHRDRGSSQVLQWVPRIPTLGRTTSQFWDFDSGPDGWTSEVHPDPDPNGAWTLVDPSPTYWGETLLAPDEPATGSGLSWVTGDAGGGPSTVTSHNYEELHALVSPMWDATDGSTILSFDYWSRPSTFEPELWAVGFFLCPNYDCAKEPGLWTTQRFLGPGRYGWQRMEVDISRITTPTTSTYLVFGGIDGSAFTELGVDNVRIEKATVCTRSRLELSGVTVDDSPPGWGNGNGFLEPGEVAKLYPQIENHGDQLAPAPTGTVSSRAPGVAILDPTTTYADIAPAASGSPTDDGLIVALPPEDECFGTVPFEFVFTDASGERTAAVWSMDYGEVATDTLLQDDFKFDLGWSVTGAGIFEGGWFRGDPAGTLDGANQANPEDDSPNDANTQCYVTGNRGPTADIDDVDPGVDAVLTSPPMTLDGYRHLSVSYDQWFYDSASPSHDNSIRFGPIDDGGVPFDEVGTLNASSTGWESVSLAYYLDPFVSLGSDLRWNFTVTDSGADDIVEAGVDNVRITAERQECFAGGPNPPYPVGNSLVVSRAGSDVDLQWTAPPSDASHDPAVYYRVYTSSAPDSGFAIRTTSTTAGATLPVPGGTDYIVVGALNGGGTSGEGPVP